MMVFFAFNSTFLGLPFFGYMVETKTWKSRIALRLKHEQTDAKIWILDDVISDLNNLIEDLEKLNINENKIKKI